MSRDRAREPHVVGRYMLCDEIAAGGMATVHIGRLLGQVGFARTVAIKRLHAHFAKDPEFVAMFLDEARIAARVRHPNVVSTLDVVMVEGEMLVVMEYVHGEPLSRLVRACRAHTGHGVPPAIALTVMAGALNGLHAAHEARDDHGAPLEIVHRDVSPQNILLGQDGIPRVVDFGVAKATGRLQATRDHALKGKLAYMSPEQVASDRVDRRTDIYAASVVLWEMLTGERLFSAENQVQVLNAVLHATVAPPSSFSPGISPAIDALVLRGLSRDASARFATAADMAEALQQIAFATPGQISAWVRDLGGDALAQRAARVVEIESTSSASPLRPSIADASVDARSAVAAVVAVPPPVAPFATPSSMSLASAAPIAPQPAFAAASGGDAPGSQISSVNVASPMPPRSRAPLVIAALAPVVVATLLGGGLLIARRQRAAEARAAQAAAMVSASSTSVVEAPQPVPPPVIDSAPVNPDPPVASASAEPAISASSSASSPPIADAPKVADPKPAPAATAKVLKKPSCNPPYKIDARGVRVPKMECL